MLSSRRAALAALTTVALAAPLTAFGASADAGTYKANSFYTQRVITGKYLGPLQFAVSAHDYYVSDAFTSTLNKVSTGKVLARGGDPRKGGDVEGVAVNSAVNDIGYVWSTGSHKTARFGLLRNGKLVYSVNLASYEANHNPDKVVHYGVDHPSACVRQALTKAHIPVSYTGEVDSHPYAVAFIGDHTWVVGDAGANALLKINTYNRTISTLSVLPRQPLKVTSTFAKASHLPACVVGITYYTESVPTDVEAGPHGTLFASILPGGPEGAPGIGPRGRIYKIDPTSGYTRLIGTGFSDLTNIAVAPNGYIFGAELGAGRVARLVNGRPGPSVYKHTGVVSVEYANGHLYVGSAPALVNAKAPSLIVQLGQIK